MKRALVTPLLLLAAACGTPTVTEDAGVDTTVTDAGPIAVEDIPSRPALGTNVYDRAGRPFVAPLLLGVVASSNEAADAARTLYNRQDPQPFLPETALELGTTSTPTPSGEMLRTLGPFDGLDGACGVGNLTASSTTSSVAYQALAGVLADDRLWVDTSTTRHHCDDLLAVEMRTLGFGEVDPAACGGRAPHVDALDAMLWLVTSTAAKDGVGARSRGTFADDLPF